MSHALEAIRDLQEQPKEGQLKDGAANAQVSQPIPDAHGNEKGVVYQNNDMPNKEQIQVIEVQSSSNSESFIPETVMEEDHSPAVFVCNENWNKRASSFKFFNMLVHDPNFLRIVEDNWCRVYEGSSMFCLMRKLKAMQEPLRKLSRERYSDIDKKEEACRKEMIRAQSDLAVDFWQWKHTTASSWHWNQLLKARDRLAHGFSNDLWCGQIDKVYTVKDGYNLLLDPQEIFDKHKFVWNSYSIPKHCFIVWLAIKDRLRTKNSLSMFMQVQPECILCNRAMESRDHLFFECS
ncbi:hypothetical protein RIF29_29642 [Crotalaria pallida]|uniref:Reverse transcriptase zinc-binding domain-containing protein n=1 Tax=Crotalaria pallida TaxID=3830 RepID=A0AAN9EFU5_CROPI